MTKFSTSLRKSISKATSPTLYVGFDDTDRWVSTGSYALNRLLSGRYDRGFPYGSTVIIGGKSGSGKSLLAATAAVNAQRNDGALVVWLDVESASKRLWLEKLGMDTSEDKLMYMEAATIEDVKKVVSIVTSTYAASKPEEQQPVFVVIDSYTALLTSKQFEEAEAGAVVGDQGQKAKQLKDLILAITHLCKRKNICVVGMVHTMASQDKYNPDEQLTGGRGLEYLASLVVVFDKLKLKVEQLEDGELLSEYDDGKKIVGIRCKAQVYKSRFSKPNETVFVQIPYPNGIDKYSGLFDLMVSEEIITSPSQGWYQHSVGVSEPAKFRKAQFREHADAMIAALTPAAPLVESSPHATEGSPSDDQSS